MRSALVPGLVLSVIALFTGSCTETQSEAQSDLHVSFSWEGKVTGEEIQEFTNSAVEEFRLAEQRTESCFLEHGLDYPIRTIQVRFSNGPGVITPISEQLIQNGFGISAESDVSRGVQVTIDQGALPPTIQDIDVAPSWVKECLALQYSADLQSEITAFAGDFEPTDEVVSQRGYVDAEHDWVTCMSAKGYDFRRLQDAAVELNKEFESMDKKDAAAVSAFQSKERDTALALVQCFDETIDRYLEESQGGS